MPVIEVQGLTKTFRVYKKEPGFRGALRGLVRRRYETVTAVQEVSFQIESGEFVGFLGPNGAGKTTTLKMLSGLLYPTCGTARVLGYVPWERPDGYRRQFALLLGQKNQLWWDLPARETFALNAAIYGLDKAELDQRVVELTERLGVRDKLDVVVRELSLGERMKLELIAVLLHRPRVLFLDEPTLGLDVVSQKVVRDFLREYNRQAGTTILLTSHDMADIEELCERVIIIDHGRIIFDGPLTEVLERYADFKLITLRWDSGAVPPAPARLEALGQITELNPAFVRLRVKRDQVIPVCKALLDQFPVRDLDIREVPVEEVIRNLFSRRRSPPDSGGAS
ncbi:ABC transporter ATP-binding protein [Limisphaera sp. VF-2]|jgi:ABC-2 type transport system ATP-binding protein|uniref:ABC transporter ATP-binding protein n=1 Tax=Limisphaera sp. VF-2 TaxID=3400418 RepID=UPI0017586AA4